MNTPTTDSLRIRLSRTVAFRLVLLTTVTQTALLGALAFAVIHVHETHLTENVKESASRLSDLITRSTQHSMLRDQKQDVQTVVTAVGAQPGIEGLRIFNKRGTVVFSTDRLELGRTETSQSAACIACHPTPGSITPGVGEGDLTHVFTSEHRGRILRLVRPINNEHQCSSAPCHAHGMEETKLGVLEVRMSLAGVDEGLNESRLQFLALSLAAIILSGFVSGGFIWWLVHRPVRELVAGMRTASHGRLDQRLTVTAQNEVGDLARAFNFMLEELAKARTEITEWSRTLEQKVEQKTAALERAHRQVVQAEKMSSLGKLSASVAHELNNPLEGILTFAKLLIKRMHKSGLPPQFIASATEELQLMADEAQRCGDIVRNLLVFSRQGSTAFQNVRLSEILDRCVRLVHHTSTIHNIRVQTECTEDDGIECDPGQVQQVLLALMLNAIEAMSCPVAEKNGGTLSVTIAGSAAGADFLISVKDTGVGIAPEIQGRIFDPFFTTKSDARGVGLGLSVAMGIVERHCGTLTVESSVGRGTTFSIRLPATQNHSMTQEQVPLAKEKRDL
jgi:two-component system, NtrC family, sensor kinase